MSDLRYALRTLLKSPAFSSLAILTLALGIGANTAIFSVIEGTLLRPLPFPHPEQLVRLYESNDENGARSNTPNLSEQTVAQWREFGRNIFQGIGAATGVNVLVGGRNGQPADSVQGARVSANFFSVLGLPPARGRSFTREEDRAGGPAVAIVSDGFWRQHLNARTDVIGSTMMLDGAPHTIVGVMPKSFRHPYRAEIWLPLALPEPFNALNRYLYCPARLRPGLTVAQAEAAVRRMCAEIDRAHPSPNNPHGVYMPPLRESFVMNLRPKILVIVGAALCALLIAAANFSGLLLSRVIEREGEFALRAALGASRRRLVRQQLVHALLLAVIGTLAGLLVATWATPALFALSPEGLDATGSAMREFDYAVRMDWPVFTFAASIMMFVGFGFGLLPAWRASRADLRVALSGTARGATLDRGARQWLRLLVVVELAVTAALLMAGITATEYFRKLIDEPWGFETANRLVFHVTQSDQLYPDANAKKQAIQHALTQLRALPGVEDATVTTPSPMEMARDLVTCVPEGARPPEPPGYYLSYLRSAIPGYFKASGPTLKRGREFRETDTADAPPVCIVSDAFAKRFWPGENPIGKRVKWGRLDGPRPWLTVVGLVGDMRAIADPRDGEVIGTVARPLAQLLFLSSYQVDELTFVVQGRTKVPDEASVRAALARAGSRLAAYQVISLGEAAAQSRTTERFVFILVSLFGALGLILAAVGLYGLLSLQVARRQREFGIRSALGATARQIIGLIAHEGLRLLGIGLAAGAVATWGVVRLVQSQWAEMPAPDIIAWLLSVTVLAGAALVACWLPARRAAHIDPVIALRQD